MRAITGLIDKNYCRRQKKNITIGVVKKKLQNIIAKKKMS